MADNRLFGPDTMNAPWGLDSRLRLVALACDFFNASKVAANHAVIGKKPANPSSPTPLAVTDFLKYLEVKKAFPRTPNAFRVARIVERMVSAGLLVRAGLGSSSIAGLQDHYLYMATVGEAQRDLFRLVPVLGPEYLYSLCAPSLVHITGTNDGVAVAGTGLVVHASHILTCRHVVSDMELDQRQVFQDGEYAINAGSIHRHPEIDVAVMRVNGPPLSPMTGALLQAPVRCADRVHARLPQTFRPSGCVRDDATGSGDERIGYFIGGGEPVPLFRYFQTGEQRRSRHVRGRLCRGPLHRECDRSVRC